MNRTLLAWLLLLVVTFAVRAQKTPIRTGQEALVGRFGVARSEIPHMGTGTVQMGGESWTAELEPGEEKTLTYQYERYVKSH